MNQVQTNKVLLMCFCMSKLVLAALAHPNYAIPGFIALTYYNLQPYQPYPMRVPWGPSVATVSSIDAFGEVLKKSLRQDRCNGTQGHTWRTQGFRHPKILIWGHAKVILIALYSKKNPGTRPQTVWGSGRILYDGVDVDGDDDDDVDDVDVDVDVVDDDDDSGGGDDDDDENAAGDDVEDDNVAEEEVEEEDVAEDGVEEDVEDDDVEGDEDEDENAEDEVEDDDVEDDNVEEEEEDVKGW